MKTRCAALVTAVVLHSHGSEAQVITGNDILSACSQEQNLAATGFCVGYVVGSIEGMKWGAASALSLDATDSPEVSLDTKSNKALGFCIPEEADNAQTRDVFLKFLDENPGIRHESARTLLQQALQESFPCGLEAQR